ncbi:hypothetical protein ASG84_22065 [Rhodococcus sp. Leaf278]|uniref:hypothetical protein n=1 Tax=Rhodococcus sp. Leaf278 TaxID=1736319 RepID=UPI00070D8CA8|nr:hypothetical protein [Rhodococcus sp. Leaf278]KQU55489.1 hypothetical protein ASG84_22065 [Rhodococcus sp. Leaf278]
MRTSGKNVLIVLGVLAMLGVGIWLGRAVFEDRSDTETSPDSSYGACVEDAALYLHSMLDISMEEARSKARTSPNCGPLRPRSAAAASRRYDETADTVEGRLFPAGATRADYAGLYEQICQSVFAQGPKYKEIERMQVTGYSEAEAEFLYEDAYSDCG